MARITACALLLTTGCSFLVASAPTPPPANPDCNTSHAPPIIDIGIAVPALFLAGISAGGGSLGSEEKGPEYAGLAVMGVALASSVYGFIQGTRCRSAYDDFAAQHPQQPSPYAPYNPPITPYPPPR